MKGLRIRTETRSCGSLKFDPKCDLCKKTKYPMAGWDCKNEGETWACIDCLETTVFEVHHYEKPEENEE